MTLADHVVNKLEEAAEAAGDMVKKGKAAVEDKVEELKATAVVEGKNEVNERGDTGKPLMVEMLAEGGHDVKALEGAVTKQLKEMGGKLTNGKRDAFAEGIALVSIFRSELEKLPEKGTDMSTGGLGELEDFLRETVENFAGTFKIPFSKSRRDCSR
jgi:hypothetical protein